MMTITILIVLACLVKSKSLDMAEFKFSLIFVAWVAMLDVVMVLGLVEFLER